MQTSTAWAFYLVVRGHVAAVTLISSAWTMRPFRLHRYAACDVLGAELRVRDTTGGAHRQSSWISLPKTGARSHCYIKVAFGAGSNGKGT